MVNTCIPHKTTILEPLFLELYVRVFVQEMYEYIYNWVLPFPLSQSALIGQCQCVGTHPQLLTPSCQFIHIFPEEITEEQHNAELEVNMYSLKQTCQESRGVLFKKLISIAFWMY